MQAQTRPENLDSWWNSLQQELSRQPMAAEETELPLRSDEGVQCYAVKLSSWGSCRIFGYLSVPTEGTGPFPAYYYLPRYQSVMEVVQQGDCVDRRKECVTFSIGCRGQRNCQDPFRGEIPGMLTEGINQADSWPMRGWVADCLRGMEYLLSRPEVDPRRVAGIGFNDFSLLAAALHPGLCCVSSVPGLFLNIGERLSGLNGYPLEEYADYARTFPGQREAMLDSLNRLDPRWLADRIQCPAFLRGGPPWGLAPLADVTELATAIGPQAEVFPGTGSRSQDGIQHDLWIAGHLGLSAPVLPEHWRSDPLACQDN